MMYLLSLIYYTCARKNVSNLHEKVFIRPCCTRVLDKMGFIFELSSKLHFDGPNAIELFFMLNSAAYELFPAHKC